MVLFSASEYRVYSLIFTANKNSERMREDERETSYTTNIDTDRDRKTVNEMMMMMIASSSVFYTHHHTDEFYEDQPFMVGINGKF